MANRLDLSLFGPTGPALSPESWAPDGVRGADKVAGRFVYFLVGSTEFLDLCRDFRSEFDLFAAFAACEPAAAGMCWAAEYADEDASERYGATALAGVEVAGTGVTLTLNLVAADGSQPTRQVDITLDT